MDDRICIVAITDDWEASARLGEYEVASRGVLLEPGGFIQGVEMAGVGEVRKRVYGDVRLPLVRVDCSVSGLAAHGIRVERDGTDVRVLGPIPIDADVVLAVEPLP